MPYCPYCHMELYAGEVHWCSERPGGLRVDLLKIKVVRNWLTKLVKKWKK